MKWCSFAMLFCCAVAATAGEAVDKTLTVKPDGIVRIENVRGRIDVQGWDRDEVSVKGTLDDEAKSLTFESADATTTVKVETPDHLGRGEGSNLVIHVPAASRVRVGVVSAELALANLRGGVDARTVSGGIDAHELSGRVELATVSGNMELAHGEGQTTFSSVSGDIEATVDSDEISIGTVSGDADVRSGKPVRELMLHSVSGDIDVSADLTPGARVKGSTTSGDVRLTLNRDAGAVFELRTTSGRIRNALTAATAQRNPPGGHELEFTMGDGAGVVELTSVSGALELLAR